MRHALALAIACTACLGASSQASAVRFDANRAFADLKHMVDIGPRPSGSPAIEQTQAYIRAQLTAAGLKPEDQAFDVDTPVGRLHMVNIRATLPGQTSGSGRIVIGGHYDTKRFTAFRFVGANDFCGM